MKYNPLIFSGFEESGTSPGGGGGGAESTFTAPFTFKLGAGDSFGKYKNGETAAWTGLTGVQAIKEAGTKYIIPTWSSFSITGQATTVEIGTTISGSKTFTWGITPNDGTVATIDLYDNTAASTLLAGTLNDGTQAQAVTTNQLNADGATQSWKGKANDTGTSPSVINSSDFTVTSRYNIWRGALSTSPTDSATVRAMPVVLVKTSNTQVFILDSGVILTKFGAALPPGRTINQVIDLDALNANITANYVLIGSINVLDAGGTNRAYNYYEYNIGAPYSANHRHQITMQ